MFNKYFLFLFVVWLVSAMSMESLLAIEPNLIGTVNKYEEHWKEIDSLQIAYTKSYKIGGVVRSFPDCYWESNGGKIRSTVMTLKDDVEVFKDIFYDGKDRYELIVPRSQYPLTLTEIKLCDYTKLSHEGYRAIFIPGNAMTVGTDMCINFPLPRYFFVDAEEKWMTLSELVDRYPSKVISSPKNTSGDELVEIAIEGNVGKNKNAEQWKISIFINSSKDYNVDSYQYVTATKVQGQRVQIITECTVDKYIEVKRGCWVPGNWNIVQHNGNPAKANPVKFFINDCRVNDSLKSRLDNFHFPVNFPVLERTIGEQPDKIHIWGLDNKSARSFDDHELFLDYYTQECPFGEEISPRSDYFVLRIVLMISGLIMIAFALYRLYAKDR